jgi:hypothetical protein
LWCNDLGPEVGKAIAEALKVNETITTIMCVLRAVRARRSCCAFALLPTG